MKRMLCLLLALVMMMSLCVQAFADEDVLYCRMCGKQIPTDSKVCPYCGEKVVHVTAETGDKAAASGTKTEDSKTAEKTAAAEPAAPVTVEAKPAAAQTNSAPSPATLAAATSAPGPFNSSAKTDTPRARVYVTKSPTSESVPYGGSCTFIAHAANATSVTWYIATSDGGTISTASDAARSVSGLYVSGANSDTLYISGIPSWWNGCQVQACFTGEGGPVYTDIARIWTYEPATGNDTSRWTWKDWFRYYYRNDPFYWDHPWDWYNYWVKYPYKAPFWFRPAPDDIGRPPVGPGPRPEPKPDPKPDPRPDPRPAKPSLADDDYYTNVEKDPATGENVIKLIGKDPNGGRGYDVIKIETGSDAEVDQDFLDFVWENQYGLTRDGAQDIRDRQLEMKEAREQAEAEGASTSGSGEGNRSVSNESETRQAPEGEAVVVESWNDGANENTYNAPASEPEAPASEPEAPASEPEGVMTSSWIDANAEPNYSDNASYYAPEESEGMMSSSWTDANAEANYSDNASYYAPEESEGMMSSSWTDTGSDLTYEQLLLLGLA